MRLTLENFKQHLDLTLDFPDTGLVRLAGPSGRGKTTIIDAFREALLGESSDPISWGKSSCKVELDIPAIDLNISRTRGPHTITVTHKGEVYVADAAQKAIFRVLGLSQGSEEEELGVAAIVNQGHESSLLSLGAAEQLRIIQKLACGGEDPEKIKEEAQALVDEKTQEIDTLGVRIDAALANLNLITSRLPTVAPVKPEDPGLNPDEISKKIDAASVAIAAQKRIKEALEADLNDPSRSVDIEIAKAEAALAGSKTRLARASKELSAAQEKTIETKTAVDLFLAPFSDAGPIEKAIEKKRQRFTELKRMIGVADKIKALLPDPSINPLIGIQTELDRIGTELDRLSIVSQEKQAVVEALTRSLVVQECPACHAPLSVKGSLIVGAEKVPPRQEIEQSIATARHEISTIANETKALAGARVTMSRLQIEALQLKESLTPDALPHLKKEEQLESFAAEVKTKTDNLLTAMSALNDAHATFERQDAETGADQAKLDRWVSLKATANLKPADQVRELLEAAAKELTAALDQKTSLLIDAERAKTYSAELARYGDQVKAASKAQAELELSNATIAGLTEEHAALVAQLGGAQRMKHIADFAASEAVQGKTDEINKRAKVWLDRMFEADGTSISLTTTTQTQKGDLRAKVGTTMFHKGHPIKKIKTLSGGERSRAFLGFQIALSEMYSVPFLLVDEGLTGTDQDLKEVCIEVMREAARSKLVLVIEHGAPDAPFDQVIEIR